MKAKEKEHKRICDAEIALRSKINELLSNFARKEGLKATAISIGYNQWYKGEKNVPMFDIDILYKHCYME